MGLGKELIKYRTIKGLSQPETARLLGVAQSTYCDWESDTSKPKPENYIKIAQFYNLDLKDLMMKGSPSLSFGDNNSNISNVFIKSPKVKVDSTEAINRLSDGLEKLVLLIEKLITEK